MPCLEITTMVGCPLRCTYCPQDALREAYGPAAKDAKYLALEDFGKVIGKLPPYVRIDFSGMSEPWANPQATDMLALALEKGFSVGIYTTLYGMGEFDADRTLDLIRDNVGQVEKLCLHLPDRNGNMRGFKWSDRYERILAAFLGLGATGTIEGFEVMTMDGGGGVHPSITASVAALPPWIGNGRGGALDKAAIGDQPIEEAVSHDTPLGCGFTPFYDHNVMLPNGDVYLCCMDYSLKHRIGNLIAGDYWSLFSSKGMNDLRVANMHYGKTESICRSCTRATCFERKPESNQFWDVRQ